jgi:hypothetical protein
VRIGNDWTSKKPQAAAVDCLRQVKVLLHNLWFWQVQARLTVSLDSDEAREIDMGIAYKRPLRAVWSGHTLNE